MDRLLPNVNIVLYQPEIPHNTGAIGRTCVAIGAKLWIVRPTGFRLDNKHLRRAGMDYWDKLNWEDVSNFESLEQHFPVGRAFFFTKHAEQLYTQVAYRPGDFLVFGRESSGLPESLRQRYADQCVRLPMRPEARSLNLANAAAVAAYEVVRQIT